MSRLFDFIFGDFERDDAYDPIDQEPMPRGTSARYLIEMADVLRAAGLSVVEVDGWETRARGSGGYQGSAPWCVMWHHTASNASPENDVSYIINAEDAPIANLYLARDGAVWVCAAGASNTNGKGGPFEVSRGVVPLDRMNEYAVSIEAANGGTGEPWSEVQIDAFFRTSLALTDWLGLEPDDALGHFDWTPGRKIDPARAEAVEGPWKPRSVNSAGTWNLDDIRAELLRRHSTEPEEGEDMTAATLWRPQGYLNVFLIGAGSTVCVSPEVLDSLTARGVPIVVEAHEQLLKSCLFQSGLTEADLVPGGG